MSRWGSSSRAALALLALPAPARGEVLLTQEEALRLAFPGCGIERGTAFLTKAEVDRARKLAGVEVPGAIAHPYVARKEGKVVGTAYFDAHRVRTLPETLMVVVDPNDRVRRVEVLSFEEPREYLPRGAWYEQFRGRDLDEDLALRRGIPPVAGATLTARATTEAVRRVLALHRVLRERESR
ncbi:MAG: FMN-binding protein [Planctomycetota bacterium]